MFLLFIATAFAWGFRGSAAAEQVVSVRVILVLALSQLAGFLALVTMVVVYGEPRFRGLEALWAAVAGLAAMRALGGVLAAIAGVALIAAG